MPAEVITAYEAKYPIQALASYQLRDYRLELENALTALPESTQRRALIR